MNPNWQSFLATTGAVVGDQQVLHFGNAANELEAAQKGTVVVPLSHLGLIQAEGEDSKAFLHGQFTSDINHLTADSAQLSSWCSAKGRMQASFLVWREDDDYVLALAKDLQEAIQKRLTMFVLRAKVKISSLNDQRVLIGISGAKAEEALSAAELPCPSATLQRTQVDGATVIRLDANRYLVSIALTNAESSWKALATVAQPAGVPAWRWLDVQAAFPLITLATKEEFVPQMADFEKMGGVSFHKGCYPGQEIVARTQYLGKVKRHLYRIRSEVALTAGQDLHSPENPDQTIGTLMTVAPSPVGGFEALAVVQANYASNVHLGAVDGPLLSATAVNP